jgi:hypothetical protein
MTQSNAGDLRSTEQRELPRRDWILIPLAGLLTIVFLVGFTEMIARWIFPKTQTSGDDCVVFDDASTGARGIPNSVCWEEIPEGRLTEYRFNSCGHRAGMECGHKPPGTYRIVMVGTSFAMGGRVPEEQSFGQLLPVELSRRTGLKVQLYNEAIPDKFPSTTAAHFDEVLKAEPDLVLLALTSRDIQYESKPTRTAVDRGGRTLSAPLRAWRVLKGAFTHHSFEGAILDTFNKTRTSILVRHVLYQSQSQYLKTSVIGTDDSIGYLNSEPSAEWQKKLEVFAVSDATIEAKAKAAGVPVVTFLLPDRATATMIQIGEWPAGIDPFKLDEELRDLVGRNGGDYIDLLPALRTFPNPRLGFFPVDGHPNPQGHAMITEILANELTSGAVAALSKSASAHSGGETNR